MTRTPLRPLARILDARDKGENPDAIERENIRMRHEEMRDRARSRAQGRLQMLGMLFFCAFATVGVKMGALSAAEPEEPTAAVIGTPIVGGRAEIVDRNGRILASNLVTHSLYVQPPLMTDPAGSAAKLVEIFPDLDLERLTRQFTGERTFVWIKRKLSPEQMQAVHDIGDPGLLFGPREMRLYPNGRLASHVLGGYRFGEEGVSAAELVGRAGVERALDDYLRDPANGARPLELSIDLSVQAAVEKVLDGGMRLMNAKGAAAVVMDVHTGEVISLASLPDFDPNDRPAPPVTGNPEDSPLFNRAAQGVYELGSTFKIFTAAQAMELGLANPTTQIDSNAPLVWGKFKIGEFEGKNYGPTLSLTDVIVKSSNVGTGNLAKQIGSARQETFLRSLGLLDPLPVELGEAPGVKPLLPPNWSEISTITISFGHGVSTTPLHLAAAYSSILNGGRVVKPTLLRQSGPRLGERVVSEATSALARAMLRQVVVRGTASMAEVAGYAIGGKTGTADKQKATGGYEKNVNINTFAGVFPAHDPKYVIVVTLDEAEDLTGPEPRRTAGWTAVPVAAEIVRRAAPLLGLRPEIEPPPPAAVTVSAKQ
ncbi:peptidoglycan D,D-transpeptidase FtsI family protein [Anianabacter salinae]|uniref:peptidoglycan D,D-transpeptidase FtsI family protein n=1 Tax=Anianabacter salinae TaxID=2851023 RepID=UPI00225DFACA|nr:penicillin-binding protein 2 [Anianabacter salinae]MBV0914072.1 penicillin-binding protein 2 [Anianabacter salinae]